MYSHKKQYWIELASNFRIIDATNCTQLKDVQALMNEAANSDCFCFFFFFFLINICRATDFM